MPTAGDSIVVVSDVPGVEGSWLWSSVLVALVFADIVRLFLIQKMNLQNMLVQKYAL